MASNNGRKTKKSSGLKVQKTGNARKKTSAARKRTAARRSAASKKNIKTTYQRNQEDVNAYHDRMAFEMGITMLILFLITVFCYFSFFNFFGKAGIIVSGVSFGFFGYLAWFIPIGILIGYVFSVVNKGDSRVVRKLISLITFGLSMISLSDLMFSKKILTDYYALNHVSHPQYFDCMFRSFRNVAHKGKGSGGIIGHWISGLLCKPFGMVGAAVILVAIMIVSLYMFYGLEWMGKIRKRNAYKQEMESTGAYLKNKQQYKDPSYSVLPSRRRDRAETNRKNISVDLIRTGEKINRMEYSENLERSANKIASESMADTRARQRRIKHASDKQDFTDIPIFRNDEEGAGLSEDTKEEKVQKEQEVKKPSDTQTQEENTEKEGFVFHQVFSDEEETADGPEKEKADAKKEDYSHFEESAEEEQEQYVMEVQEPDDTETLEETSDTENLNEVEEPSVLFPLDSEEQWLDYDNYENTASEEDGEEPLIIEVPAEPDAKTVKDKEQEKSPQQKEPSPKVHVAPSHVGEVKLKPKKEEYVSNSEAFNKLNASRNETEHRPYIRPSFDLLQKPPANVSKVSDEKLRMTAAKLQSTLASFRVKVSMGPVTCGPSVTRYEIVPAQGVRVSKITNLADDIKLSLAAQSIRIEAPIPGKSAIGIEVPNEKASPVYFRELLENEKFQKAKTPLAFVVGKDIAGKLIMGDIAKMTHLLIAGATGSGKSVCINTLIMSLIYKTDPNEVKMIMIDPKVVELSVYNDIPHLLCPVVSDPKEAAAALNWAAGEMDRRYKVLTECGVRNLDGYNKKIANMPNAKDLGYEPMPYIVVIVDEFADLMMVASKSIEDSIKRLSQLARAAGIHLVLATQRPSVNVITGVIKANIPSRIAFSVASSTDSRTILDRGGAEKLLGRGDMLFSPSYYPEPVRVQGAFVTDEEVNDVTDYVRENNNGPAYNDQVTDVEEQQETDTKNGNTNSGPSRDEYFEDAGRFVIESDRAAAGQLQRRFSIGFNRAGRIIDQLYQAGVVGPSEGTKPRKIMMTIEQFDAMLHGDEMPQEQNVEEDVAGNE